MEVFGFLWLLIEPAALFLPEKLDFGWNGYFWLILISSVTSVFLHWPRLKFSAPLASPDSVIEIKVGDLFEENGHLVIGTNDVFDTELGEVISSSTVQGQFLQRIYKGDIKRLNEDIELRLKQYEFIKKEDIRKIEGKNLRYPIGTTITLGEPEKRYFLVAYAKMNNNLKAKSNADHMWISLSKLWKEIREKGQGRAVCIPIVGSELARTGLPRMTLIKLVIMSFIVASKDEFITNKLTVMIYPPDLGYIDWYELKDFLISACF